MNKRSSEESEELTATTDYCGISVVADERMRPGVVRAVPIWMPDIDWPWPERRPPAAPRRPFDHARDRWCW